IRVMFTHPQTDGFRREVLEGRVGGSIVTEIFQGIVWAMDYLNIPPENIRLLKASPSIFTVFAWNTRTGVALLNPYPLMAQAFLSFSLIIRSSDRLPGQAHLTALYETLYRANFNDAFYDQTGKITVDLQAGIDECCAAEDGRLKRHAVELRDYLKGRPRRSLEALRNVEGEQRAGTRAREETH
ncbi:MAG: hypothetical protein KGR98_05820, partial [Verrucomicrobia bacterium]|nr:hypothetical protein [Verrucomicrobiota bacterium]